MIGDQSCINYLGQIVEFTENGRTHILKRHPEMDAYIDEICDVLAHPEQVYSQRRTKTHWYYKLGICRDHEAGAYLLVIVGYNDERPHRVKTSFPTSTQVNTPSHFLIFPARQQI